MELLWPWNSGWEPQDYLFEFFTCLTPTTQNFYLLFWTIPVARCQGRQRGLMVFALEFYLKCCIFRPAFWCQLKKPVFLLNFSFKFHAFFVFLKLFLAENDYIDQCLGSSAPKCWLKYTTHHWMTRASPMTPTKNFVFLEKK